MTVIITLYPNERYVRSITLSGVTHVFEQYHVDSGTDRVLKFESTDAMRTAADLLATYDLGDDVIDEDATIVFFEWPTQLGHVHLQIQP